MAELKKQTRGVFGPAVRHRVGLQSLNNEFTTEEIDPDTQERDLKSHAEQSFAKKRGRQPTKQKNSGKNYIDDDDEPKRSRKRVAKIAKVDDDDDDDYCVGGDDQN